MMATAAHMAHTRFDTDPGRTAVHRRPVRRPIIDVAPWMAPFAWMIVLAITVVGLGSVVVLRDRVPSGSSATIAVRVAPADTLWSIAEANRMPGVSTARTVEAIARINGLDGTAISAGATLQVPASESADAAFAQAGPVAAIR